MLDTARKSAFLSHTRLLEMNTGRTANDAPNLFTVAVEKLLADYEATVAGELRVPTVGELWAEVTRPLSAACRIAREHVVRRISQKRSRTLVTSSMKG